MKVKWPKIVVLETKRLKLRPIRKSDAIYMFNYAKNKEVTSYVNWEAHKTVSDSKKFIKSLIRQYISRKTLMWAIELKSNNIMIGTCGFMAYYPLSKTFEIGYALNPDYWHQGIIKEALTYIIDYAFNNLDIVRIEGYCITENIASANTMKSCGLLLEGTLQDSFIKHGKIFNSYLFAITKKSYLENKS